jgi:hypothetical protein
VRSVPRGSGRSVGRGSCRLAIEPRKGLLPDADRVTNLEGNTVRRVNASGGPVRRGQRPQHAWTPPGREPRDLIADRGRSAPPARAGKAGWPKPAMNGGEKSDPPIVAVKPANGAGQPVEERGERRGGAAGNACEPHGDRTQDRGAPLSRIARIRKAARDRKGGEVHHPAAPRRRRLAGAGLSLAETGSGARSGRDDMGGLRRRSGGAAC